MPKIPELPPILTGNATQDIQRMREYLIRFVQEYSTEDAGYASSNEEQGNSSSDNLQPSEITVDAELSLESTNPIQNRAVAEAFANLPSGGVNLVTREYTKTGLIAGASSVASGNITVTLSGYTPIGIVEFEFSNSALVANSCYVMRNNYQDDILVFCARNISTSLITGASANFTVLYMENTE
ncbi:MAG: hypothetical protein IJK38_07210 [Oscillospiraceae bacterium]|nr:hypothetical protein [Oscillospiraceae bacterium]MBR0392092.1 hypothetical protein [Oscillospiraceae bacterium]